MNQIVTICGYAVLVIACAVVVGLAFAAAAWALDQALVFYGQSRAFYAWIRQNGEMIDKWPHRRVRAWVRERFDL